MSAFLLVVVLLVAFLAFALLRAAVTSVTVFEFERGLRYDRGRFTALLEPGRYWTLRDRTMVQKIDTRPRMVTVPSQEVLSADGVALKVSLAARFRVVDPVVAVNGVADYQTALYTELQLTLRAIVCGSEVEALLAERGTIGPRILATVEAQATRLGLALEAVEVKDLTLPGELKKLFTQVVKARQEGLAALEKARGETAALRNLANAAQLVERSPQLMQLRLLQVLGEQPGNTVVLGAPMTGGPFPVRSAQPELPRAEPGPDA